MLLDHEGRCQNSGQRDLRLGDWGTEPPPAGLDRRAFLSRAALLGASGVALAACSATGSPKTGPSKQPLDKNATLNFQMSTTIPGLDPQKWWNGAAGCGQFALFETLAH